MKCKDNGLVDSRGKVPTYGSYGRLLRSKLSSGLNLGRYARAEDPVALAGITWT